MINPQLTDYIKQQLEQGTSREHIKNSLTDNGWNDQDVEEGFRAVDGQGAPAQPTEAYADSNSNHTWGIVAGVSIFVLLIIAGVYFASRASQSDPASTAEETSTENSTDDLEEAGAISEGVAESEAQSTEAGTAEDPIGQAFQDSMKGLPALADSLSSCTPYTGTYTHPFTGEAMEREVVGVVNGSCLYVEQMPQDGKMECRYSESQRVAVAELYRDMASAQSFGTSAEFSTGDSEATATYTIDGEVVEDPLQEAMNDGTCIVSGY